MSNLLSQASLVMIPSGYKEDVVYSAIPTNGSGDLSFTRASNGTRVNSAGLVEVCPWNLVDNSENFSAVYIPIYATLSNNTTSAPNGTTTADSLLETTDTEVHAITTDYTQPSGAEYTYSVYVKTILGRNVRVSGSSGFTGPIALVDLSNGSLLSGSTGASVASVGGGWYRISLTATTTTTQVRILIYSMNGTATTFAGSTSNGLYLWGAQLNIGSTAKPYFPTTDRLNVPRLTYQNGGGGCPSLLLEKQSTNLITYSEDLAQASWLVAQLTVTSNATTSPDGTQNADKIAINNGLVGGYIYQSQSTTSSTIYTGSFFVKSAGIGFTKFWSSVSGSYCNAIINLSTGVITNGASPFPTIPTATNFGNGWWRVSYTETSGGGSVPIYVDGGSTSNGGDITGNGTDGIYLWGAQLEASSYPTSYIPTTSSSATRVADVCSKSGISSLIGQTEGVIFADVNVNITGNASNFAGIAINDGTSSNVISFGYYQEGRIQAVSFVSGSLVVNINLPIFGLTSGSHKFALAYKLNDYVFYVDGVQVGSDTSASVPATSVFLLSDLVGADISYNQAVLFPTRLTNAELAQLTA